jgi:hypothetical protein
MSNFSEFDKQMLYSFFDELKDYQSSAGCNDVYFPKDWSKKQVDAFSKVVYEANGLADEYEEGCGPDDTMVLDYLIKKLKPFIEG